MIKLILNHIIYYQQSYLSPIITNALLCKVFLYLHKSPFLVLSALFRCFWGRSLFLAIFILSKVNHYPFKCYLQSKTSASLAKFTQSY